MNEHLQNLNGAIQLVLPEAILLATVCVIFFAAPFLVSDRGEAPAGLRHRWGWLSLLALLTAGWICWTSGTAPRTTGPFLADGLTLFVRGLTLATGAILVLLHWNQADDSRSAESHACLLAILAGVDLVAAANDLVGLFVALELISIPTYLFLLLPRRDAPSQEATLKYFLLSIFSSAVVLFGLSYLYGATGTTNLTAIHHAFSSGKNLPHNPLVAVATVMLIAGLGFRLTAVPFHFYAPDVFQGAPKFRSGDAVFHSQGCRSGRPAAIDGAGRRWRGDDAFVDDDPRGDEPAVVAGRHHHVHRKPDGADADRHPPAAGVFQCFPRRIYDDRSGGRHAVDPARQRDQRTAVLSDDLRHHDTGRFRRSGGGRAIGSPYPDPGRPGRPEPDEACLVALILSVFLFSLAGLPPTGGFLGKFNLFYAAWSQGSESSRWLASILAVNAVLGAWYYLKLIGIMYLRDPVDRSSDVNTVEAPSLVAAVLCTVGTIGLFVAPGPLWHQIESLVGTVVSAG